MNQRFENINLLRAFAAIAVVVYHVIETMNWSAFPINGPLLTFRIGWIGVDLFFVISGFVITRSALALYRQDGAEFWRRYWAGSPTKTVFFGNEGVEGRLGASKTLKFSPCC